MFVKQFINNAIANSDLKLDFDDSIKSPANIDRLSIDSTSTEGKKFNEIYDSLCNVPEFKKMFVDLFGDNQDRFNVKFEIGNIPQNGADYKTGTCTLTIVNNQTNPHNLITIDRNFLLTKSKLDIATTILHECIHAYLNIKLRNPSIGMSIPNINNLDVKSCINTYYNNFIGNQAQHSFFVDNMIPTMTAILSQLIDELTTVEQRIQVQNPTIPAQTIYEPIPNSIPLQISANPIPWNWTNFLRYFCHRGLENCTAYPFHTTANTLDSYYNAQYTYVFNYVFNP